MSRFHIQILNRADLCLSLQGIVKYEQTYFSAFDIGSILKVEEPLKLVQTFTTLSLENVFSPSGSLEVIEGSILIQLLEKYSYSEKAYTFLRILRDNYPVKVTKNKHGEPVLVYSNNALFYGIPFCQWLTNFHIQLKTQQLYDTSAPYFSNEILQENNY